MNVASHLLSVGSDNAPAIMVGSMTITYQELRSRVAAAAGRLLVHAAHRQDRIALLAENGEFFVVGYLAAMRAGLIAVPVPTDASSERIASIVGQAGARIVLASRRYEGRVREWLSQTGARTIGETELFTPSQNEQLTLPEVDSTDDLAALMFTSGSTGTPKGVMVSHRNIAANTADIIEYMRLSADDRALVVMPFSYCFGLSLLHTHLAVGASVVIHNKFMYPETVLQELTDRGCTGLAGVPSTYQILLRKTRFKRSRFPSLRWLQQAGGRLAQPYIQEIVDAFPGVRMYVMYGQTEATARLSYLPPERLSDKAGSVGTGLRSTRLEVLRSDGTPVAPGSEVGEIVASGENVTQGYWGEPDETAKYFRHGKLYTGDLASIDEEGFIYIVDRQRDIIKSGGNRVSATEIEDAVAAIAEVVEVAVVGVPHDLKGEAIVAFVTTANNSANGASDIMDDCRRVLSSSKTPEAIVHLRQLPRGPSGKILKTVLRALANDVIQSQRLNEPARTVPIEIVGIQRLTGAG